MNERDLLPPVLEARLLEAIQPDPLHSLGATDAAAMHARVLKRISSTQGLTTIQADEGKWAPFSSRVSIKVLRRDTDTQTYLLRLEPGAVLHPHIHGLDEECLVLEGEVRFGDMVVKQGAYHLAPRGVAHESIRSEFGALLFLRGAIPAASHARV